ncbi:MAG: multifunctional CCA addition/repair protein [Legionellales bacterium]|nr:multifunctional CCA addition/repair protein [Legionellales bacterium]
MKVYLVGGAVRDKLLGIDTLEKDWVVVGATPKMMLDEGFRQVGRDFPVFIHPVTGEEYALARTEKKVSKGYTGFVCFADQSVTLEEDLKRRDLTINAIAMDESGEIIDPYKGREDLQNKVIRHVSASFSEDPLRILRLARFAAKLYPYGFRVAKETKELLLSMVAQGELIDLTPSRVWQELHKVLHEDRLDIFFMVLRYCGALQVLFPEIDGLFGVPQDPKWHPEVDTGKHFILSLRKAAKLTKDLQVRFAVLCHDFGKALTDKAKWPKHHGHESKGVEPVLNFCKKYNVPNAFRDLAVIVTKEHLRIHTIKELSVDEILEVLERMDVFRRRHRLEQVLLACMADALGRGVNEGKDIEYPQKILWEKYYNAAINVNTKDIIKAGYTKLDLAKQIRKLRILEIQKSMS